MDAGILHIFFFDSKAPKNIEKYIEREKKRTK